MRTTLILLAGLTATASAQSFPRERYPIADDVSLVAAGDFDGDGRIDAAVVADGTRVDVHPGLGDGRLGPVQTSVTPWTSQTIADIQAADLNGDGRDDLVTRHPATPGTSRVRITLADPETGFATPFSGLVEDDLEDFILRDLDGDDILDLVAVSSTTGTSFVRLGDGSGDFEPVASYDIGALGSTFLAIGDLDGDGHLDIVVNREETDANLPLPILRGDGAGAFAPPTFFFVACAPNRFVFKDTNDGPGEELFLVTWCGGQNTWKVFYDGTRFRKHLASEEIGQYLTAGAEPVDLNGDQNIELVRTYDSGLRVRFGTFNGFASQTTYLFLADSETLSHDVADMDGDGDLDVLFADATERVAGVRFNAGDDLIEDAEQLDTYDGCGGYVARDPATQSHAEITTLITDLDGDGYQDFVGPCPTDDDLLRLSVVAGLGSGTSTVEVLDSAQQTLDLGVADLDGDGDADLVHTSGAGYVEAWLQTPGGWVLFGNLFVDTAYHPRAGRIGDLDEDGLDDLVTISRTQDVFGVHLGLGGLAFAPPSTFGAPGDPVALDLLDVDEDGHLDVLMLVLPAGLVTRLGDGQGGFGPEIVTPMTTTFHMRWDTGDIDGDGWVDVVVATGSEDGTGTGTLQTVLGDGTGAFAVASTEVVTPEDLNLQLGDIDRDGRLDLVTQDGAMGLSLLIPFGGYQAYRATMGLTTVRPGVGDGTFGPSDFRFKLDWLHGLGFLDPGGTLDAVVGLELAPNQLTSIPWTPLGGALAGTFGLPDLIGEGVLEPGATVRVRVDTILPDSFLALVLGLQAQPLPLFGGTLVPALDVLIPGLPTGPDGFFEASGVLPIDTPAGLQFWLQVWVVDPSGPQGWAATNSVQATVSDTR